MNKNIRKFYQAAITEREGVGTAYEYLVKYRLLSKVVNEKKNSNILVAGLPEKYGYSLDFILLSEENDCNCEVVDERIEKLNGIRGIFEKIHKDAISVRLCDLYNLENIYTQKHFDLAFSCEVLQRLSSEDQIQYIRSLKRIAKNVILFVPNGDNRSHKASSGLNSITRKELVGQFNALNGCEYRDIGYLDIPPWPPGVKDNPLKGRIGRTLCNILLNILQIISVLEPFYPKSVKSKYAHLIYVIT